MTDLPVPWEGSRPSRQLAQATRAQEKCELEIFRHGLAARFQAECDRADTQALSDVLTTALDEELGLLRYGLDKAAGSAAAAELVSRKVSQFSEINSRRIARRFGG
jgi:hypothetical protein